MLLTLKQVAEHLHVSQGHVKRLIELRELEALDISILGGGKRSKLRIPDESLEIFIQARTFKPVNVGRRPRRPKSHLVHDFFAPVPPSANGNRRLKMEDVAEFLNLTLAEVDLLSRLGHLRAINSGSSGLRVNEKDLWAFMQRCKIENPRSMLKREYREETDDVQEV